MQINLTGFLNGKNSRVFMGELWELVSHLKTYYKLETSYLKGAHHFSSRVMEIRLNERISNKELGLIPVEAT